MAMSYRSLFMTSQSTIAIYISVSRTDKMLRSVWARDEYVAEKIIYQYLNGVVEATDIFGNNAL